MSVFVDLSSEQLNPKAVATLVKAHVKSADEDILFKVSRKALQLYCGKKPKNAIKVSKEELRQLNQSLKGSFTAGDFLKRTAHQCSECGRTFTFFDFFQSGRKRHGDGYMAELFSGNGYHLHVQKRGKKLEIDCTVCGAKNVLVPGGYDGPDY